MRLAIYTDYKYRRDDKGVYAEKAFSLFIARLAQELDGLVLLGRVDPNTGRWHYRLPDSISFVPLPWYGTLAKPIHAVPAMLRSIRHFWRVLDDVDGVWLLGPHLLSIAFVMVAVLRRKRVVLGARQDLPRYVARRHPRRPLLRGVALLLEGAWRTLARRHPIVVVGPDLEHRYRRAIAALGIYVSLVEERAIESAARDAPRDYSGQLTVLSVGRLEREKNPLLLADVLALLRDSDPRWRLLVCGEGPMQEELVEKLDRLGLADHAELRGYVPTDDGLDRFYRDCHVFLHVAWTEGMPQVLVEAFAAGLPVVATAVGGVAGAADGRALLVPAGDPQAAAEELRRLARDPALRTRLTRAATDHARRHTVEIESRRVADFMRSAIAVLPGPERKRSRKARATALLGSLLASIAAAVVLTFAASASGHPSRSSCDRVASPGDSVQSLVNGLAPGETGCLRGGIYRANELTLSTRGIRLASFPGERATVAGRMRVTGDRVTVEGLTLDGRNARDLPSPTINADEVLFRRNNVSSSGSSICFILGSLTEIHHPMIKRNRIHNCGMPGGIPDHGIYMQDVTGARIIRNTIYDNAERGIKIGPDSQRALIRGNVIDGNPIGLNFSGDESHASSRNVVTRNVISNSTGFWNVQSFWPGPIGTGNLVSRNCVHPANPDSHYDENGGISRDPGFTAAGNLIAAPLYVNREAKNFRLRRSSPCRAVYGRAAGRGAGRLLGPTVELGRLIDGLLGYLG